LSGKPAIQNGVHEEVRVTKRRADAPVATLEAHLVGTFDAMQTPLGDQACIDRPEGA
jgi:hypothetical protein